jgi:hypothetical protein
MTPILAGPVKRSIIARIAALELADPSDLGDSVQVEATLPPEPERKCVFGGRTQWVQRDVLAERYAASEQVISFEVRVRVVQPGDDIDGTEKEAERIVSLVASGVLLNPDLTGGRGRIVPSSGTSDPVVVTPSPEPSVTVNLGLTFTVTLSVVGG